MEPVRLTIPSDIPHISQILTGFLTLRDQGWPVTLEDRSRDRTHPFHGLPVVLAQYRGKRLLYDLWDGYQDTPDMEKGLAWCEVYFKRSFCSERNRTLFPLYADKIHPLGFNYHVTHRRSPIGEPGWKALAKNLLGRAPDRYFTPEVFEGKARQPESPRILFLTRLWDDRDPTQPPEKNRERTQINRIRIEIIRTLRERYGGNFLGGLNDGALSEKLAPDLILPARYTERKHYIRLLHDSDICIGSMGLHESIGWKTGEYVAAAKAIVNETFRYRVPGDFREGVNYLPFETAEDCVRAVDTLAGDLQALCAMERANEAYYRQYLRPDMLARNTLELTDRILEGTE